jgi:hypothetical protein
VLLSFRTNINIISDHYNRFGASVLVRHVGSTESSSGSLYNGNCKLSRNPQYNRYRELPTFLSDHMELDQGFVFIQYVDIYANLSRRIGSTKVLAIKFISWERIQVLH